MALGSVIPAALGCMGTFPVAAAAATSCPLSFEQHRLTDVGVFEGPPAELGEMIGAEGTWQLEYYPGQGTQYYLGCRYDDVPEIQAIPVPTTATLCRSQLSPRTHMQINVVCE